MIDTALEAGRTVVVVSPNQLKNLPGRFTSLPRAGRLLAEIGDCRARVPTPESLACPAGVAP